MRGLLRYWLHALAAWWGADQIRVSPREGRLLRIGVGSVVQVPGDEPAVVVARRVAKDGVHYRCTGLAGERSLSVRPLDDGGAECLWQRPDAEVRLPPDEVHVFGVADAAPMSS